MTTTESSTASTSHLSTRISLRWLPESAHETTDTIVMSVKDWYLDLRVDKTTGEIDWAIAGERIIESRDPMRVTFTHELDSHGEFSTADCGIFVSLPNGDDLETGIMPRPDLPGAPLTEYEEVWRDLPFREGPPGWGAQKGQKGISWIIESDDGDLDGKEGEFTLTKTFLGRIWGTFLALQQTQIHTRKKASSGDWRVTKTATEASARREEWDSRWCEKYVIGPVGSALPSMADGLEGEGHVSWRIPGEKVVVKGRQYVVRGFEEIQ